MGTTSSKCSDIALRTFDNLGHEFVKDLYGGPYSYYCANRKVTAKRVISISDFFIFGQHFPIQIVWDASHELLRPYNLLWAQYDLYGLRTFYIQSEIWNSRENFLMPNAPNR